ncbi:MAG: FG-GAP-like repeat-containing protein [Acidobacteriota bacterium]|jgi:hypothetical protein
MAKHGERITRRRRPPPAAVGAVLVLAALAGAFATLTGDPVWTGSGGQESAAYGVSVAGAGDVNGDGFGDVLVGASLHDSGSPDTGRIFLYLGSAYGLTAWPQAVHDGANREAWLGYQVASAGDVNGDGFADIVAGSHGHSDEFLRQGGAFLWLGSAEGPWIGGDPVWAVVGDRPSAYLGKAVRSAGDVNGDGYDDIIVGAFGYSDSLVQQGAAFVYFGSPQGPSVTADWKVEGTEAVGYLGFSVCGAGDVNGDGYADVAVGAHLQDGILPDEGRVLVHLGGPDGPGESPVVVLSGGQAFARFGYVVAPAGDVNGDGYDDLLVGAPGSGDAMPGEGRVYTFLGSPDGLGPDPAWFASGGQAGANFGVSAASVGDLNSDGYGDVLVGANQFDGSELNVGEVRLFPGGPDGLESQAAWIRDGGRRGDLFGSSVAGAGDVNGDGFGDAIIGATAAGEFTFAEGEAYLFLGLRPSSFRLQVSRAGNGTGTVSSDPVGIDCGDECHEVFPEGTLVQLTAIPDAGSTFGGWTGDADCADGIVQMDQILNCTALFHLESELCRDEDGDGYGSPATFLCPHGMLEDCDDLEETVHPGAPDICDGLDNNCDGGVDAVICTGFDANADGRIDGIELAWIGRAFGEESATPDLEWWFAVDYNEDGRIDGDDLALLGTVWFCLDVENVCN